MKKLIAFLFVMLFSAGLFAQTKDYTEIKVSALPKNATTWIKKNMPQATVTKAAVGTENNATVYFAQLLVNGDKRIIRFDKNGNFLGKGARDQDKNSAKPVPIQNTGKTTQPAPTDQKKDPAQPAKK